MVITGEKKKRMKVFGEFYDFNEKLIINLKYGREKVDKVAEEYTYVKSALAGKQVLKGADAAFIADYLKSIGSTDALTQIDYLTERREFLKKYRDESEQHFKKNGSLWFKLCLMAGILIAVLLA